MLILYYFLSFGQDIDVGICFDRCLSLPKWTSKIC